MLPLNLYAHVRFFVCYFAHETAGAARTRSSPRPLLRVALRPLIFGANELQNSGAVCREKAEVCLVIVAGLPRSRISLRSCGLRPSTSLRGALATKQSSSLLEAPGLLP